MNNLSLIKKPSIWIYIILVYALSFFPDLLWIPRDPDNSDSLDFSFNWSLAYAAEHHLQLGVDYLSTYGPLGFLNIPDYFASYYCWLSSVIFVLADRALFLYVIIQIMVPADRVFSDKPALIDIIMGLFILLAFNMLCDNEWMLLLACYGLMIQTYLRATTIRNLFLIALCLALCSQIKVTALLGAFALVLLNLICGLFNKASSQQINAVLFIAILVPLLWSIIWMLEGQDIGNLRVFFSGISAIVAGYGPSMALSGSPEAVVVSIAVLLLFVVASLQLCSQNEKYLQTLILSCPILFLGWKEGMTRQDEYHLPTFFLTTAFINFIFSQRVSIENVGFRNHYMAGFLVSLSFVCITSAGNTSESNLISNYLSLPRVIESSFKNHSSEQLDIAASLKKKSILPPELIDSIRPIPTLIMPSSLLLAPTFGLPLVLPPIPQAYIAHSTYLDEMNIAFMKSAKPDQIIYRFVSIDDHYLLHDAPEFTYEIINHYSIVKQAGDYAIMARNAQPDRPIKWERQFLRKSFDEEIPIPTTGSKTMIFVKVNIRPSLAGRVMALLYKDSRMHITFNLTNGTSRTFLFIYRVGSDGLLVSPFIGSLTDYALLIDGGSTQRVKSIVFTVEDHSNWQYTSDFAIKFGKASLL